MDQSASGGVSTALSLFGMGGFLGCPEFWSLDPWMLFPAVLLVGPVHYVDHNKDESGRQ